MIAVQFDRARVTADRVCQVAEALPRIAKAVMKRGYRPVAFNRALDVADRLFKPALLPRHDADQMQRVRVGRIMIERLPVQCFGAFQTPGAVLIQTALQGFQNRRHVTPLRLYFDGFAEKG